MVHKLLPDITNVGAFKEPLDKVAAIELVSLWQEVQNLKLTEQRGECRLNESGLEDHAPYLVLAQCESQLRYIDTLTEQQRVCQFLWPSSRQ